MSLTRVGFGWYNILTWITFRIRHCDTLKQTFFTSKFDYMFTFHCTQKIRYLYKDNKKTTLKIIKSFNQEHQKTVTLRSVIMCKHVPPGRYAVAKDLKDPSQPRLCYCWHTGFSDVIFYAERVKTKEIAVKLLKVVCNKIWLHFSIFITSMASKMADFKDFRAWLTRVL